VPGEGDVIIVTGKGNKTRMVPVLQNVLCADRRLHRVCPHQFSPGGPIFVGARGGPLSPRIIQLTMERLRGALGYPTVLRRMRYDIPLHSPVVARRDLPRIQEFARPRLALDSRRSTPASTASAAGSVPEAHPRG